MPLYQLIGLLEPYGHWGILVLIAIVLVWELHKFLSRSTIRIEYRPEKD